MRERERKGGGGGGEGTDRKKDVVEGQVEKERVRAFISRKRFGYWCEGFH